MKQRLLFSVLLPSLCIASSPGKTLYQNVCADCHAPRVAAGMHAPAAFDTEAWQARFAIAAKALHSKKEYSTINDYFLSTLKLGKGLMPHGGLCKESRDATKKFRCSNDDYLSALYYMSGKKRPQRP